MPLGRRMGREARRGEARTAEDIGGRCQPASGATAWAKGDVASEHLLVERKDTSALRYSLRATDLEKLRRQALAHGKIGVFQVAIGGRSYAVVDWQLLLDLLEGSPFKR